MNINRGLLKHLVFWLFYVTAFWGAFEQAYKAPGHPIWSTTWNTPIPVPHHYIFGFLGLAVAYFMFTIEDWTLESEIREELERFKAEILGIISSGKE
jgi:hypothetical protein